MRPVVLLEPGPIDARTGGFIYNARIVEGLRTRGWPVDVRELDVSFPSPTAAALTHAGEVLGSIPDGSIVVVDSLALGAMADLIEQESSRLRFAALMHLPLRTEDEGRALSRVPLVIVTSPATVSMLARYGLPFERIAVVEPGTDRAPLARGSGSPPHLLCVATLIPRKGHDVLLQALAAISTDDWRLTCAGSLTLDPATAESVRAMAVRLGIGDQVSFVGELNAVQIDEAYAEADLFVLATREETYGMAVAEALARGVPVISTATGAIPALVGKEAGIIVQPGDIESMSDALETVLGDRAFRERLGEGARSVREALPSWDDATGKMGSALSELAGNG